MSSSLLVIAQKLLSIGGLLLILNEIRGAVMTAPVLLALWRTGNSAMDVVLAVSIIAGIAISVIVPVVAARRLQGYVTSRIG